MKPMTIPLAFLAFSFSYMILEPSNLSIIFFAISGFIATQSIRTIEDQNIQVISLTEDGLQTSLNDTYSTSSHFFLKSITYYCHEVLMDQKVQLVSTGLFQKGRLGLPLMEIHNNSESIQINQKLYNEQISAYQTKKTLTFLISAWAHLDMFLVSPADKHQDALIKFKEFKKQVKLLLSEKEYEQFILLIPEHDKKIQSFLKTII